MTINRFFGQCDLEKFLKVIYSCRCQSKNWQDQNEYGNDIESNWKAMKFTYPDQNYVLDDSRVEVLASLAEEFMTGYFF